MGDTSTAGQESAWEAELDEVFGAAPLGLDLTGVARHVLENAALWSERLGVPLPSQPAAEVPPLDDILDFDIAELIGAGIASYVRTLNGSGE